MVLCTSVDANQILLCLVGGFCVFSYCSLLVHSCEGYNLGSSPVIVYIMTRSGFHPACVGEVNTYRLFSLWLVLSKFSKIT